MSMEDTWEEGKKNRMYTLGDTKPGGQFNLGPSRGLSFKLGAISTIVVVIGGWLSYRMFGMLGGTFALGIMFFIVMFFLMPAKTSKIYGRTRWEDFKARTKASSWKRVNLG